MIAADPAAQRRPRLARDRRRPVRRPGADAGEQQERQRLAPALDLDLLRLRERRTRRSRRSRRTRTSRRRSATGSTTPRSSSLAGKGAIQAPGVIPSMFLGSLPQSARVKTDIAKAKAALAASGVGDQKVTMIYPSDLTINGVPFTSMAQKVQSSLQGGRLQRRALGLADLELARRLPLGEVGVRPLALGPRLPGSRRLPGLHARAARRAPRGLAEGRRPGDREARRQGAGDDGAGRTRRASTGRSSGCSTRAARSSR